MRSEEEIRKRLDFFRATLADTYYKNMPYEEERLMARISEDEWFLNNKPNEIQGGVEEYKTIREVCEACGTEYDQEVMWFDEGHDLRCDVEPGMGRHAHETCPFPVCPECHKPNNIQGEK